jgi:hypothetical protein
MPKSRKSETRRNSRNNRRPPSINGKASDQRQSESAPTPACELARALDPRSDMRRTDDVGDTLSDRLCRTILNDVAKFGAPSSTPGSRVVARARSRTLA